MSNRITNADIDGRLEFLNSYLPLPEGCELQRGGAYGGTRIESNKGHAWGGYGTKREAYYRAHSQGLQEDVITALWAHAIPHEGDLPKHKDVTIARNGSSFVVEAFGITKTIDTHWAVGPFIYAAWKLSQV